SPARRSREDLPSVIRAGSRLRVVPPGARALTMGSRQAFVLGGLAVALGIVFLLSLVLGSIWIPVHDVIAVLKGADDASAAAIVVETIRLPRSITAMLAGAALAIAGLQMQTLFRNPLADPFALGIASGASLGVAIVVLGTGYGTAVVFGGPSGL